MKRFVLLLVGLLVLGAGPFPVRAAAASGVGWQAWDRGLEEARSSGKRVLVDVHTQWCGWCRRMQADVYSRADVRDYLQQRFVVIRLDAEASDPAHYEGRNFTSRSLAARFGVTGYPTTLFLRSGGEHLVSVPGYVDADRFLRILKYIGDGHLERGVTFQEYSRQSTSGGARR